MLYHLSKEGGVYVMKYKIPVVEGHKPSGVSLMYNQIDLEASSVIASLVWEANGNDPDLTKHPWALHSVWRLPAAQTLAVILEWQPTSALPRTLVVGNMTTMASSSTSMFTPSRSSNVAEADDTASIMYVVPHVDYS
jgi:hypothetical protein